MGLDFEGLGRFPQKKEVGRNCPPSRGSSFGLSDLH